MLTKRDKAISMSKHLWNQAKIRNKEYNQTVTEGKEKFEQFDQLAPEVFDELYSTFPAEITENETNGWARNFLNQMKTVDKSQDGQVTGWEMLRQRCEGNDLWAEMATESFLQSFVSASTHEGTLSDTEKDKEVRDYLKRLKQEIKDQPKKSKKDKSLINQLNKQIKEKEQIIKDKKDQHDKYNNNVDNVGIRQHIRQAIEKTNKDMKDLKKAIDAFSFGDNPHSSTKQTSEMGKKLSKYVQNSHKIKKIMELLGRLKRVAENEIKNKPKKGTNEIVGIELGKQLERILPSQLMYLSDENLENVFLKRFVNNSLMQYELNEEPPKKHGPIIACIDSSGSMGGDRIQWAMAVILTLLHVAKMQKRDLQVIHFGRDVLRVDDFKKDVKVDIDKVMSTIDFFDSSGGTSFNPPVERALDTLINTKEYENADIVFITDGCAEELKLDIKEQINVGKNEAGLKFFSIIIGSNSENNPLTEISNEVINLYDVLKDSDKINKIFGEL